MNFNGKAEENIITREVLSVCKLIVIYCDSMQNTLCDINILNLNANLYKSKFISEDSFFSILQQAFNKHNLLIIKKCNNKADDESSNEKHFDLYYI